MERLDADRWIGVWSWRGGEVEGLGFSRVEVEGLGAGGWS